MPPSHYGKPPVGPPPPGAGSFHQLGGHYPRSAGGGGYPYPQYQHHYSPHHPPYGTTRSSVPLVRSVVTHSFSMEEEQREDGSTRYAHRHDPGTYMPREEYRAPGDDETVRHGKPSASSIGFEPPFEVGAAGGGLPPPPPGQYGRDLPPVPEEDARLPTQDNMRGRSSASDRIPPSPNGPSPPGVQRTFSAGSYRSLGGSPLKRSFWHHSRPSSGREEFDTILPQEFMPPKRSKMASESGGHREYVVTARTGSSDHLFAGNGRSGNSSSNNSVVMASPMAQSPPGSAGGWGYGNRAMSWEAREDYYRRDPRSAPSSWSSRSPAGRDAPSTGSHWSEAPYMPSPRSRYETQSFNNDIQTWGSARGSWGAPGQSHDSSSDGGPPSSPWPTLQQARDGPQVLIQSDKLTLEEREGYDVDPDNEHVFDDGGMHFTIRPPPHGVEFSSGGIVRGSQQSGPETMKMDSKNAPVRLLALPEDRISLSETLCIVRENIEVFQATTEDVEAPAPGRKHAVSVGQVGLRCIHCRQTTRSSDRVKRAVCYPSSIKRIYRTVIDMKLDHFLHCKFVPQNLKDTLTALKANNTRSTGTTMQYFIRAATQLGMVDSKCGVSLTNASIPPMTIPFPSSPGPRSSSVPKLLTPMSSERLSRSIKSLPPCTDLMDASSGAHIHQNSSMSSEGTPVHSVAMEDAAMPNDTFAGHISLALPEDKMSLSPLRCFLREQVCAFTATEQDIAVRTPTTFSVSVGQVGVGCIHCMHQPAKLRLNRAACFPFSITRIYQAVADIQRFHLSECKAIPQDVKEKFLKLQSQSSKGSKGLATRQYWVTSAKKLGLADTPKGIRFIRDPAVPEQKSVSLDILAQVASHVTTVNRPLVLPEDKPFIAEFLYVVMEQLQPCRFTEADRNKRRIKHVGCIGVECKHCSGKVDSRKFFWSSVNAVESNFVSVHTHMMECKMVPQELKDQLAELKKLRKEQTAALKTGSQKSFFARVWKRLHEGEAEQGKKEREQKEKEQVVGTPEAAAGGKPDNSEVNLSQAPMELTPTPTPISSPQTMEKPVAEIESGVSPSAQEGSKSKLDDMNDRMADVTMSEAYAV
ncbi:MAG: hypothetical protein SGILL_001700 [Bacillariaceae sp.]